MRRSYFSRVARGYEGVALQPPRPVASLWKAARLDWLASTSVRAPRNSIPPPPPHGEDLPPTGNETTGMAAGPRPGLVHAQAHPAPPRDRAVTLDIPQQHSRTSEVTPAIEPRRPPAPKRERTAEQPEAHPMRPEAAPVVPAFKARPVVHVQPQAVPAPKDQTGTPAPVSVLTATRVETVKTHSVAPSDRRTVPGFSHGRNFAQPFISPRPSGAIENRSIDAATAEYSRARPARPSVLEPIAPEPRLSLRQRELITERAPQSQSRPEGNRVEIGKLEVQVIAPPALPRSPRAPLAESRLARGYALWSGF
jgi:hypothetical protein